MTNPSLKLSSVSIASEIISHCVSGGLERLPAEIVADLAGIRHDANAFENVRNIAELSKEERNEHFKIAREKNIKKISDKLEEYAEGDEIRLQKILKHFEDLCTKAKNIKTKRSEQAARNVEATKARIAAL